MSNIENTPTIHKKILFENITSIFESDSTVIKLFSEQPVIVHPLYGVYPGGFESDGIS
jgi:hypothetical protein